MWRKAGRVVKEHVQRTHRQSQRRVGSRVGGGDGWGGGGVVDGKWRQRYLSKTKKMKKKKFINI